MPGTLMKTFVKTLLVITVSLALTAGLVLRTGAADETPAASLPDLLGQLKTASQSGGDSELKSLGGSLGSKIQSLGRALESNPELKGQMQGALQSLLGGKYPEALNGFQKLSQAKLTTDQMKLAKEVRNVGSAYLVQKNFGALEGSQTEVAQAVTSLRKGELTSVLPPLQKIGQNAKLTPAQKDLLGSLAEKCAPGAAGKVGDAVKGLKSLPGFGK
jgi:hypothetical protein